MCIYEFPKHMVSMQNMHRIDIEFLFQEAENFSLQSDQQIIPILRNKILCVLFYDSSTRTRLSFEVAMKKLGGGVTGFSDMKSSRADGFFKESYEDTIKVVSQISDCILVRHFETGAALTAAKVANVPVINCGDGGNEHPTQALLDLWTMKKAIGNLDGSRIALVGNIKWRSMRSILYGLVQFKIKELIFLMPYENSLPEEAHKILQKYNISWQIYDDIADVLKDADVIEMIPFSLPTFENLTEKDNNKRIINVEEKYKITRKKILSQRKIIPILHIGPRGPEIDCDVDTLPNAYYFQQVKNGIYIRMALLKKLIFN